MLAKYSMVVDEIRVEDQRATVHGIACHAPTEQEAVVIRDISTDSGRLHQWATLMNRLELLPIHFRDVVEDILAADL